jgi:hypothetical protein
MMSKRIFSSLLLAAATALPAIASQPQAESAIARLSNVHTFAIGGVGFAGTTSEGEKNFLIIAADPRAMEDFENLYRHGNAQARAYALLGIYTIDPARFHALSAPLSTSQEKIATMRGCIMSTQPLNAVVKEIGDGAFHPAHRSR